MDKGQQKASISVDASKGLVTSRDSSTLAPGELNQAIGCEYRVGSPHLYKLPGRTVTAATATGSPILAINKLQYDGVADIFAVDSGGSIYEGTSIQSTAAVVTGLSTTAIPQYTGFKNEWIRCNGVDQNYIRESGSVPNGTQGNWRTFGMDTALFPAFIGVTSYQSTNTTVRPTTNDDNTGHGFAPSSIPGQTQETVGYHDPQLAYDGPGTGTGYINATAGSQAITGSGTHFDTELSAGANIILTTSGESYVVQSVNTATSITVTAPVVTTVTLSPFTYTGSTSTVSPAPENTNAWAFTGEAHHILPGTSSTPVVPRIATCIWKFTTNLSGGARFLSVMHSGDFSPSTLGSAFDLDGATWLLEYSMDGGSTWQTLKITHQAFGKLTDTVPLPDSLNMANNLWVRATITSNQYNRISGHWLDINHGIYDIKVANGSAGAYTATNPIYYAVSESYTDSDNIIHQSNIGVALQNGQVVGGLYVDPSVLKNVTSVTIGLPRPINPLATRFNIWRSVDTPGGGYPVFYKLTDVPITDTTYTDLLNPAPNDTAGIALLEQYKVLEILFPTGESIFTSYYTKPPLSFMTLVFQGCVVYFPSDPLKARQTFYSLNATVTSSSAEQVPEQYYLDYQTPKNDTVVGGAVTNGGRSMIVFFENYTMLVNYLPQGSDPGGFNNTVKEYVSNARGCAGRFANVEFTLSSGQTLVAAVDGLGLWVTNGVNMIEEWSNDLDWATLTTGVDLTAVELFDKPHKRRLEMLYTDANGARQEMHFFYGRMKQNIDGKVVPLITGPHPSGTRTRYYGVINNAWAGFSGDASTTGHTYTEDTQAADDSHGYDSTGIVPWQFAAGDTYIGNIAQATILESMNIRFEDLPLKNFQVVVTCMRDSGVAYTLTKTMKGDPKLMPHQLYFHVYMDRFKIAFQDLTNTPSPAFISLIAKCRSAGGARDR